MAEENGFFGLAFASTKKDVAAGFKSLGVDAWLDSVMALLQRGVSFASIKSLGAHGIYDMHKDGVADGVIPGPSPVYAPAGHKQVITDTTFIDCNNL